MSTTAIEGEVVPGAKAVKHFESGQEFVHPDGIGADRKQTLKVIALDGRTGQILWERAAWEGSGNLAWKWWPGGIATFGVGVGTSPVFYKDFVILQCDEDEGGASFIVGLNKVTGKEAWRTPRQVQLSWATPVLVHAGGPSW